MRGAEEGGEHADVAEMRQLAREEAGYQAVRRAGKGDAAGSDESVDSRWRSIAEVEGADLDGGWERNGLEDGRRSSWGVDVARVWKECIT